MPGHDQGHAREEGDSALRGASWSLVVRDHVEGFGGWAGLADELMRRVATLADAPADRLTVEKGLRRLAARDGKPGGQYGRWLLRHFGLPPRVRRWAAWLGQYHSRFADLPTSLRLTQLRLWDRAPISETAEVAWIHLGVASVRHRMGDLALCVRRLDRASSLAATAGPAAVMEAALLRARIECDGGRRDAAEAHLDRVEALLAGGEPPLDPRDAAPYRARLLAQRAYLLNHPDGSRAPDPSGALALVESIPEATGLPFVDFRRAEGRAYCLLHLGRREEARALAREAAEHAADGGFVRFRILALKLLSRASEGPESAQLLARAHRLARLLEDEDLLRRTRPGHVEARP